MATCAKRISLVCVLSSLAVSGLASADIIQIDLAPVADPIYHQGMPYSTGHFDPIFEVNLIGIDLDVQYIGFDALWTWTPDIYDPYYGNTTSQQLAILVETPGGMSWQWNVGANWGINDWIDFQFDYHGVLPVEEEHALGSSNGVWRFGFGNASTEVFGLQDSFELHDAQIFLRGSVVPEAGSLLMAMLGGSFLLFKRR